MAENNMDNTNGVETESNCSYEETAAKIESALRKNLKLSEESSNCRKYEEKEWILPGLSRSRQLFFRADTLSFTFCFLF